MAVLNKGHDFSDGDQVTADKLDNAVDAATFAAGAVDNASTQLSGGAIIVKDAGVTAAKLATDSVTTTKIADANVTPAKLSTGAPTWDVSSKLSVTGSIECSTYRTTSQARPSSSFNPATPNGLSLFTNKIELSRSGGVPLDINRAENGNISIFRNAGTIVGTISISGSSTAYNTSSDYRLKQDIVAIENGTEKLKQLKPCNFAWKVDGSRVDGFIAHEVQTIVPEAVHGAKDELNEDGTPKYQGIDQSKLIPLLTKALQEALIRIEALENA